MSDLSKPQIDALKHSDTQASKPWSRLSAALAENGFDKDAQACSRNALTNAQTIVDQKFGQCDIISDGTTFTAARDDAHKYQFTQVDTDGAVHFSSYNSSSWKTLTIKVPKTAGEIEVARAFDPHDAGEIKTAQEKAEPLMDYLKEARDALKGTVAISVQESGYPSPHLRTAYLYGEKSEVKDKAGARITAYVGDKEVQIAIAPNDSYADTKESLNVVHEMVDEATVGRSLSLDVQATLKNAYQTDLKKVDGRWAHLSDAVRQYTMLAFGPPVRAFTGHLMGQREIKYSEEPLVKVTPSAGPD